MVRPLVPGRLLVVALAFLVLMVSGTLGLQVRERRDVDLHQLCESLARTCWDLDPDDFGMTPVNGYVIPPDGDVASADWSAGLRLGADLLGEHVKVRVRAGVEANVSHSGDDEPNGQVPCADAPACPDLIVDGRDLLMSARIDEQDFTATHCAVEEGSTAAGPRQLLRFTFTSPNTGAGDLEVGDPDDHPEWFEWGACHGHWHFREYADYRLWDVTGYAAWQTIRAAHPGVSPADVLAAYPELQEHFQAGHKQGFCVIDYLSWGSPVAGPVKPQQFTDCSALQGVTSSWADAYYLFLDGQWVDVTGMAPGAYVLEAEVNPERLFAESNYANNAAAVVFNLV